MIDRETRIRIEKVYFSSEFQNLDRTDKEDYVRAMLDDTNTKLVELQTKRVSLQRYLGQRN